MDIVVEIDAGPPLGIQVKSSWKRAKDFKRDHPDIPVLVIHPEDSEQYVRVKLLSVLREYRSKCLKALDQVAPRERAAPSHVALRDTLKASFEELSFRR